METATSVSLSTWLWEFWSGTFTIAPLTRCISRTYKRIEKIIFFFKNPKNSAIWIPKIQTLFFACRSDWGGITVSIIYLTWIQSSFLLLIFHTQIINLNNKLDVQYLLISRTENRTWKTRLNVWKYRISSSIKIGYDKIWSLATCISKCKSLMKV